VWTAEQVTTLATRHYIAEAAGQVVKFVASNKLLGDPARFWSQIRGAVVELRSAPARRGASRRFRRRIAAAVAEAAKTTLQHAREVTGEVEARFSERRDSRAATLRLRRIEDPPAEVNEDVHTGESTRVNADSAGVPNPPLGTEPTTQPEHPTWEVVVGVLRAAGSLVEAPLQGAELRGLPGLLEGAAEGAMGAAANVTSATLTLASALVDKLALYGDSTFETESEESSNAQSGANPAIGRGRGGATVTPRLRPPRPPPANHLEPLLPFNGVEAMARELHQYAAGGRFAKESFQFGAKLVRPRGAFVAVTDVHVIVGVNVGSSSETGASKWLAREALPLEDVVTVSRGEAEDASVVVLRALPRRIGRGDEDEAPKGDPSDDTTLVTPVSDSALELVLRPVAYVAALAHRLGTGE
jgi:hypothetical protein